MINIVCSYIDAKCRDGSTVKFYAKITDSNPLYPIDDFMIGSLDITASTTDAEIQAETDVIVANYPIDEYTIGIKIEDACGQSSFTTTEQNTSNKDIEVLSFTITPSPTLAVCDWSFLAKLNTPFSNGDVITIDVTGLPNGFVVTSVTPSITPIAVLLVGNTLVFSGDVPAGTSMIVTGIFNNDTCSTGIATLNLSGDDITTNNTATAPFQGGTWCLRNRHSGYAYSSGLGGEGSIGTALDISSTNAGNKYINSSSPATCGGYETLRHTFSLYRRVLGGSTWSLVVGGVTVDYTFPQQDVPNVAAWINTQLANNSYTNFIVRNNGFGGIAEYEANTDQYEEYFEILEEQLDTNGLLLCNSIWQYGFIQVGGAGDAKPAYAFGGNSFQDGNVAYADNTKQIAWLGIPECPDGKVIEWQNKIGLNAAPTNSASGLVFAPGTIMYQELGVAGAFIPPTNCTIRISNGYTGIPIVTSNVSIASGGVVGTSALPDGVYLVMITIISTYGTLCRFGSVVSINSGVLSYSNANYDITVSQASDNQVLDFTASPTVTYMGQAAKMAWLAIDFNLVYARVVDFYDDGNSIPISSLLNGDTTIPIHNVAASGGVMHEIGFYWYGDTSIPNLPLKSLIQTQLKTNCI